MPNEKEVSTIYTQVLDALKEQITDIVKKNLIPKK